MSFKSNQRVIWNLAGGDPNGNRIGTPGDLLWDPGTETLWIKAHGRQTKTGWIPIVSGGAASGSIYAFASIITDGVGGFTRLVTDGFSSVTLSGPRDITFTLEDAQASDEYAVIASGSIGTGGPGTSGLFINVNNRTVNGFNLDLFNNANGDVNPTTTVVTIDVLVTQVAA